MMSNIIMILTSKATETSFLVVFTDVRLVVPPHRSSKVGWGPDRTLPDLHAKATEIITNPKGFFVLCKMALKNDDQCGQYAENCSSFDFFTTVPQKW
jgi:hypothetical protein